MLLLAQDGPGMTPEQINYIAESKLPGERDRNAVFGGTTGLFDYINPVVGPKAAAYLENAGFVARTNTGTLRITEQGISRIRGAVREGDDSSTVFTLDPDAPLDYIGLLSELDALDDPLIIDPYFHPHDLAILAAALPGARLLTIDRYVSEVKALANRSSVNHLRRGATRRSLEGWGRIVRAR